MWAEPGLFYLFLSFSQCNTDMAQNLTILKRKWCAWDSNLGLQEDWHLWIHWAMSGPCMAYSSIEFFLKKPLVNLPIVLASKNSQNLVRRERFDLCVKPLWPWTKMMMILLLSFKIFFCQFDALMKSSIPPNGLDSRKRSAATFSYFISFLLVSIPVLFNFLAN